MFRSEYERPAAARRHGRAAPPHPAAERYHLSIYDVLEPVLDGLRRACPKALAETKHLLTTKVLENLDLDAGHPTRLPSRLFASADAREGMTAFLERREPGWVL